MKLLYTETFLAHVRLLTTRIQEKALIMAEVAKLLPGTEPGGLVASTPRLRTEYLRGMVDAYSDVLHEVVTHFAPAEVEIPEGKDEQAKH